MAAHMADSVGGDSEATNESGVLTPEEALLKEHRQKRKELQARIQTLKKSINKGDKKKKRAIETEIALLESEFERKCDEELAALRTPNEPSLAAEAAAAAPGQDEAEKSVEKKATKAQKRREKKEEQERKWKDEITAAESLPSKRKDELAALGEQLKKLNLAVHEVAPDGNCLFAAISHQLALQDVKADVQTLRRRAAEYIRKNKDDFLPFLMKDDNLLTDEEFEQYCDEMEHTAAWGGHAEVTAVSHIYETPIQILQANCPPLVIGEQHKTKTPVLVSYHRFELGSGEHYNSVVKAPATADDDDDDDATGD